MRILKLLERSVITAVKLPIARLDRGPAPGLPSQISLKANPLSLERGSRAASVSPAPSPRAPRRLRAGHRTAAGEHPRAHLVADRYGAGDLVDSRGSGERRAGDPGPTQRGGDEDSGRGERETSGARLHLSGQADGDGGRGLRPGSEEGGDRGLPVSRPQAYLGELARPERDAPCGPQGAGRVGVDGYGFPVRAPGRKSPGGMGQKFDLRHKYGTIEKSGIV